MVSRGISRIDRRWIVALPLLAALCLLVAASSASATIRTIDSSNSASVFERMTGISYPGTTSTNTGSSVANAGDVNNDGRDDYLVGAPYETRDGHTHGGAAYVVYSNVGRSGTPPTSDLASLPPSKGYRIDGAIAEQWVGFSVANAGDVNGDGVPDHLIGGTAVDPIYGGYGQVYVVYGRRAGALAPPTGTGAGNAIALDGGAAAGGIGFGNTAGYRINGDNESAGPSQTGYSVANAGDINGDGIPDQLIGAPTHDQYRSFDNGAFYAPLSGITWVVFGRRAGSALPRPAGAQNAIELDAGASTYTVSGADVQFNPTAAVRDGYRVRGFTTSNTTGSNLGTILGTDVANTGDVNGDGVNDQLISAPGFSENAQAGGADKYRNGGYFVVYGRRSGTADAFVSLDSTLPFSQGVAFGPASGYRIDGRSSYDTLCDKASVAGAGDVNGDGTPDQLVGSPTASSSEHVAAGSYWVVYGRKTGSLPVPSGSGIAGNDLDLDGAGGSRNIVAGAGYRVQGEGQNTSAGSSPANYCALGTGLENAGDVTGDGVPDQLVGGHTDGVNPVDGRGRAYVVYGRRGSGTLAPPSAGSVENLNIDLDGTSTGTGSVAFDERDGYRVRGPLANSAFGFDVAPLGDVTDDGRPDLLIGAPTHNTNTGTSELEGSAYVIGGLPRPPLNCSTGFHAVGDSCEPNVDPGCPPGQTANPVTGACETPTTVCPPGTTRDSSGVCVTTTGNPCPAGTTRDADGNCVTPGGPRCPDGSPIDAMGACHGTTGLCPDGSRPDSSGRCPATTLRCPDGSRPDSSGRCGTGTPVCPDGSRPDEAGRCPTTVPPAECPRGSVRQLDGSCLVVVHPSCPPGTTERITDVGRICIVPGGPPIVPPDGEEPPHVDRCPAGTIVLPDGRCITLNPPDTCPDGTVRRTDGGPCFPATGDFCREGLITWSDGSCKQVVAIADGRVSASSTLCRRLTTARVTQNVSKWAKFGRAARARIRGPKSGFFVYSDPRSVTFSVFRYGVKLKDAKFSVDGKAVVISRGSRPRFVVKPRTLGPGIHKLTAAIRPKTLRKNGKRLRKQVKSTLRFRVLPCPPAKMTVRQSKRKVKTGFDLRLGIDSGGPSLSEGTAQLPFSVATKALRAKKARGRTIGKLSTGGKIKKSIALKLPKKPRATTTLTPKSSSIKVVLKAGRKPKLVVTGLPDGVNALRFTLRGRRNGLFVNRTAGRKKYQVKISDRGAPKSSASLSNTQKIYKK